MENFKARELRPDDMVQVNYWDYISLDVLLNLQKPKTHFPDEKIFIGYHQVSELLMMLAIHEMEQLTSSNSTPPSFAVFMEKLGRIHRYVELCARSFDVMTEGMDPQQYNTFRHALAPASGFQSFQFRKMEFLATDLHHLVRKASRDTFSELSDIEKLLPELYWREAGLNRQTQERTPTMRQFEDKYWADFLKLGKEYRDRNLWRQYLLMLANGLTHLEADDCKAALRRLDWLFNQEWPLVHYNTACRYLDATDAAGTGGSKWKEYLHPRHQKRIFYPELWSAEELANWGHIQL